MEGIKNQLDELAMQAAAEIILISIDDADDDEMLSTFESSILNGNLSKSIRKIADNFRWKNPEKDGLPPIGTVCAIRKHGETMIGRLADTEEWDDWEVNGEYEDCIDEYFVLPQNQ